MNFVPKLAHLQLPAKLLVGKFSSAGLALDAQ